VVDVGGGVVVVATEDRVLGAGAADGGVESVLLRVKVIAPATASATTTAVASPISHHLLREVRGFAGGGGAAAWLPGQPQACGCG
jgi:hypothetical protein